MELTLYKGTILASDYTRGFYCKQALESYLQSFPQSEKISLSLDNMFISNSGTLLLDNKQSDAINFIPNYMRVTDTHAMPQIRYFFVTAFEYVIDGIRIEYVFDFFHTFGWVDTFDESTNEWQSDKDDTIDYKIYGWEFRDSLISQWSYFNYNGNPKLTWGDYPAKLLIDPEGGNITPEQLVFDPPGASYGFTPFLVLGAGYTNIKSGTQEEIEDSVRANCIVCPVASAQNPEITAVAPEDLNDAIFTIINSDEKTLDKIGTSNPYIFHLQKIYVCPAPFFLSGSEVKLERDTTFEPKETQTGDFAVFNIEPRAQGYKKSFYKLYTYENVVPITKDDGGKARICVAVGTIGKPKTVDNFTNNRVEFFMPVGGNDFSILMSFEGTLTDITNDITVAPYAKAESAAAITQRQIAYENAKTAMVGSAITGAIQTISSVAMAAALPALAPAKVAGLMQARGTINAAETGATSTVSLITGAINLSRRNKPQYDDSIEGASGVNSSALCNLSKFYQYPDNYHAVYDSVTKYGFSTEKYIDRLPHPIVGTNSICVQFEKVHIFGNFTADIAAGIEQILKNGIRLYLDPKAAQAERVLPLETI